MQVSTHFHSRLRDGSNNRRPFCENPHKPVFHLMITAFVITASAFPGMDKTLSRRVTYGSPVQGRRIKMRCPVKVLTGIFHPILLSA
ncbi:hypothetical protein, partial [Bacteroides nordii]|uniref:hypothetical protein n=1 Tax=Bacteroides nordii TaxID=291645 RepID=UPI001896ABE2